MRAAFEAFTPDVADPSTLAADAALVGRTSAGPGLHVRGLAALRGDGEWVRIGRNGFFGERSTVHIAHACLMLTPSQFWSSVAASCTTH